MTTHTERARAMGYAPSKPAPKAAAVKPQEGAVMSRASAGQRVYGNPYDNAISSFYGRREAKLRDDPEALALARRERKQIADFARKRGMSPEDLHAMLAIVHEHDVLPRSKEIVEQRLAQSLDTLRKECGGTEQAQAVCQSYTKFATELAREIPSLVSRAEANGAGGHLDLIRIGARYAETVTPPHRSNLK